MRHLKCDTEMFRHIHKPCPAHVNVIDVNHVIVINVIDIDLRFIFKNRCWQVKSIGIHNTRLEIEQLPIDSTSNHSDANMPHVPLGMLFNRCLQMVRDLVQRNIEYLSQRCCSQATIIESPSPQKFYCHN